MYMIDYYFKIYYSKIPILWIRTKVNLDISKFVGGGGEFIYFIFNPADNRHWCKIKFYLAKKKAMQ